MTLLTNTCKCVGLGRTCDAATTVSGRRSTKWRCNCHRSSTLTIIANRRWLVAVCGFDAALAASMRDEASDVHVAKQGFTQRDRAMNRQ
mmetsp:Transcript_12639/g.17520  ORF Transcript_12639/g.17520 Transcript_12639/m.17520 type:complete len:89 (+) Transcript_12639:1390-1656(+)